MGIFVNSVNVDDATLTIGLSAEELYRPINPDCPPPADSSSGPGGGLNIIPSDPVTEPPSGYTPEAGDSGWYYDECMDCCYPVTDKILNYMEFKVATFLSPGYTQNITCEEVDVDAIVTSAEAAGDAVVVAIDPRLHAAGTLSNALVKEKSDGSRAYELNYNATIELPDGADTDHIEVVSYVNIDFERMKNDYGFEAGNNLQAETIKLMALKANLDKVRERGKVNETIPYFVNPATGKTWTGPVHYHPPTRGYMGGAKHTMLPQPLLVQRTMPNLKVVDNSTTKKELLGLDLGRALTNDPYDEIDRLNSTGTKQQVAKTFVSDPVLSKTNDGKVSFVFYMDPESVVRANSKFPGIREQGIYRRTPIESIQIFRERAIEGADLTELGVKKVGKDTRGKQSQERELVVYSSDQKSYGEDMQTMNGAVKDVYSRGLQTNRYSVDEDFDGIKEVEVGIISETPVRNITSRGYRAFTVEDMQISNRTSGKFRYSTEIEFKDPTVAYINRKLAVICEAKDKLEELVSFIDNVKAYDMLNKKYTRDYKKRYKRAHTRTAKMVTREVMKLLKAITGQSFSAAQNYMISNLSVQNGSPQGIENIIEVIGSIEDKLKLALGNSIDNANTNNAGAEKDPTISKKSNADLGMVRVEKEFDAIVDQTNERPLKLDYTTARANSFPSMTDKSYEERINLERRKFYSDSNTRRRNNAKSRSNLPKRKLQALSRSRNRSDYSYLTPAFVRCGTTTMDLVGDNTQIDNLEQYKSINFRSARGNKPLSVEAPPENTSMLELSEDILTELGISVTLRPTESSKDKQYNSDSTKVFGSKSFADKNTEPDRIAKKPKRDRFVMSATETIATAVLNKAQDTDILNPDAPINQDQEIPDITDATESRKLAISKFDVLREDNILNDLDASKIEQMPIGLRALFDSRDDARFNWVDHDLDLVKDPRVQDIFTYNQGSTVKVEYLADFESTFGGKSLKKPRYSPLTKEVIDSVPEGESLLVRLRPISLNEFGVPDDSVPSLGADILTENFFITSTTPSTTGVVAVDPVTRMEESPEITDVETQVNAVYDMIPDEPSTVSYVCVAGVSDRIQSANLGATLFAGDSRPGPLMRPVSSTSTGGGGY